jgi:hypothetical protein
VNHRPAPGTAPATRTADGATPSRSAGQAR